MTEARRGGEFARGDEDAFAESRTRAKAARRSFGPAYTDLIRGRDGRYPVSPILRSERSRASKVETRLRAALSLSLCISIPLRPRFRGVRVSLFAFSASTAGTHARTHARTRVCSWPTTGLPSFAGDPSRPPGVPRLFHPLCVLRPASCVLRSAPCALRPAPYRRCLGNRSHPNRRRVASVDRLARSLSVRSRRGAMASHHLRFSFSCLLGSCALRSSGLPRVIARFPSVEQMPWC